MRNGQNNKRMRGRNRNGRGPNPLSRTYESNGPDIKVRGTAQHVAEKYLQLARDAHSSGDPVMAESYLQHAEHYFRLIAAAQEQFRPQNAFGDSQTQGDDEAGDDEEDDTLSMIDRRFEMPPQRERPPERQNFNPQQPRFERGPRYDNDQPPVEGDEQPPLEGATDEDGAPRQNRRERFSRDRFNRDNDRRPRFERSEPVEGGEVADAAPDAGDGSRESRRERFERQRRERAERGPRRDTPIAVADQADEPGLGLPSFITGGAPAVVADAVDGEKVMRTRRRRGKFNDDGADAPEPAAE